MNAITRSIASAEAISEASWFQRFGSPGALVSSVVSRRGVNGVATAAGVPSGRRPRTACSTSPGSSGRIAFHQLAQSVEKRTRHLDADLDSIAVNYIEERTLDLATQMPGKTI